MPTLYFDFVDPLSYLVEHEISAVEASEGLEVARVAFELVPPPSPLRLIGESPYAEPWRVARSEARPGMPATTPPSLVPWTRKAHELHLHASEHGIAAPVRKGIYEAYFRDGLDIGRVDVLVEIARAVGLDITETKAVLDVDRFDAAVSEGRVAALGAGIDRAPTILSGAARLQGFHNRTALRTFLRDR